MKTYLCWTTNGKVKDGVQIRAESYRDAAHQFAEARDPIPQSVSVRVGLRVIQVDITAGRYPEASLNAKVWPPKPMRDRTSGDITEEGAEFLKFVEAWKKQKRRKFPSATEWLQIAKDFLKGRE